MKQYNKPTIKYSFGLGFLETILSPRLGFLRGVFLANQLASIAWQLNQNNQKTEYIAMKTSNTNKWVLINNNTIHRMLRYDTQSLV